MKILVCGMDTHLGLDLKPLRQHWKGLYEPEAECPVACHYVIDICRKKPVDRTSHKSISEVVERPFVLRKIGRRKSVTDHHVCIVFQYLICHFTCRICRICIVTIDHDVALRIDITEHASDGIAFSLKVLISDHGSGLPCDLISPIRRIVVIDIDHRLRKRLPEIRHHFFNCLAFVVARYQNSDLIELFRHY